jgi:hypothetical protein
VSSAREDAVPYLPTGAGRVSAATVETAIKLKMLMDVAIMLTEEDFEDLGWRRDVIWLFHDGREQNEITYIQTECAILVSSLCRRSFSFTVPRDVCPIRYSSGAH